MFYIENNFNVNYRINKPKDNKKKKVVKTVEANFSNLKNSESYQQAAEYLKSNKKEKKEINDTIINKENVNTKEKKLEMNYYLVSENTIKEVNNLYDQVNNISIDLKENKLQ